MSVLLSAWFIAAVFNNQSIAIAMRFSENSAPCLDRTSIVSNALVLNSEDTTTIMAVSEHVCVAVTINMYSLCCLWCSK